MALSPDVRLNGAQAVLRRKLAKDGPDSHRTANAMVAVADELRQQSRFSEELILREQVLEAVQRNLGPGDEEGIKAGMDLANCLLALNRIDDAERLFAGIIAEATGSADSVSAKKAEATYEEASTLLNNLLPVYALHGADEDPAALEVSTTLGTVLVNLDRVDEAIPLLRRVLDVRSRRLGPGDPETMSSLRLLASVLTRAKQFDEARLLARKLDERYAKELGEEHPDTAEAREFLATIKSLGESSSD
jgi:thioredoxin-like negative regulator of GroEL